MPKESMATSYDGIDKSFREQFKNFLKIEKINGSGEVTINKNKMYKFDYIHILNNKRFNAIQYVFLGKSTTFVISVTRVENTKDDFTKTVEEILNTFKEL